MITRTGHLPAVPPGCYEGDVPDATSLDTPRLRLRRWRSDDLDGFAAVNAQPEVMRYIHDGRTLDRAATAERLAGYQRHWDDSHILLYGCPCRDNADHLQGFG